MSTTIVVTRELLGHAKLETTQIYAESSPEMSKARRHWQGKQFSKMSKRGVISMRWQTLSSKKIYENRWMKVVEDQVETETRIKLVYGVVHKKPFALLVPWDGAHLTLPGFIAVRVPLTMSTKCTASP